MERDGNVEKAILSEMRKPQSNLIDRVTLHNQIILHNFKESVNRMVGCQLLGCCQSFSLTLIPNQILYPKYCKEHRSEFRRQNYLRQFASQPKLYHFGTVKIIEPSLDFPRIAPSEIE
jgi:hypothetical protein